MTDLDKNDELPLDEAILAAASGGAGEVEGGAGHAMPPTMPEDREDFPGKHR